MADRSVVIVGAGLAGLAAGCYAQMNGYDSHIFEHHTQPGGVAAAWRRRDYLIDGGIHFLMGHLPGTGLHALYRQLGILPTVRVVPMDTYSRFIHEASGCTLEITRDLERLGADLKARAPEDSALIDPLVRAAQGMRGLDMSEFGMSRPPELTGPLDMAHDVWQMRGLMKYMFGKLAWPVERYAQAAHAPWLRVFLENLFTPRVPVYFVCMLLAMLADGQLGFLEGGCADFVGALERRYRELGGKVTYGATVEKILVEDAGARRGRARAAAIRLAAGTAAARSGAEQRAGAVISAADGYSTLFQMLGGRFVTPKIRARYERWPVFAPMLTFSFGVARAFPDEPAFTGRALARPLRVAGHEVSGIFVRLLNYSPRFAPPGKTVVQVECETEWDYWNDLQARDRAAYDAEKERLAAQILERLEEQYPGISGQVEVTDVATPYTTWRYTLNHRAAWEGWEIMPQTMTTALERTLPGLDDFYMAGQWVMPGGGVPPVLYSGQHAVQLMCRRDGRPFRSGT
jgi:phytoene desaturase